MPIYNKLVRDRIPEIIEANGKSFTTRILDENEYHSELRKKMHEELKEYDATDSNEDALEELADLLELIHAATAVHGSDFNQLEAIRQMKAKQRGGFDERIFLIEVEDD
ncbi:nucleoside triphosphate pyrophosphohydrolase [Lederbergia citrea]|uniref:Nucleoside triphosphate pyrophosphohydrolase n=1 Tax=Lederbergia citrea TaxID=2833581 RepID=A0A942Z676_9BACI|nr:nucleoside triphosphate pyrophosphohydrolase [Lederbergia citrea]MBS4224205.1 nucleoside triphosphate pyrophosphohydrolase [Lederbergia citrea]